MYLILNDKTAHRFVYMSYLFFGLKTGCVLGMVEQPSTEPLPPKTAGQTCWFKPTEAGPNTRPDRY